MAYSAADPLIVVAGPGTGKTTAIVGRALRLVFVERWDPASLLLTTFTKKAAEELRSRLLGWGVATRSALQGICTGTDDLSFLADLDLNRFITGTLDSLSEELLDRYRDFNTVPPVLLDEFVANAVLLQDGLFQDDAYQNPDLAAFAAAHGRRLMPAPRNRPQMNELLAFCRGYIDRLSHDLIDLDTFAASGAGPAALVRVARQYFGGLAAMGPGVTDFARLEADFLSRLSSGSLDGLVNQLRAIFVDEFQDTNAVQEAIYYELARRLNGAITVVGDDDQSIHRFRGGTVELFREAPARMQGAFGRSPTVLYLTQNYRAPQIPVNFTQDFVELDPDFQPSRVPAKPRVASSRTLAGIPILGVFRDDIDTLATALAGLLDSLINAGAVQIATPTGTVRIEMSEDGRPGDCAYIAHSVREWNRPFMNNPATPRLPERLRRALLALPNPIASFNPRGEDIAQVPDVERLCGLMLLCLDPDGATAASTSNLPWETTTVFNRWRQAARALVAQNPAPSQPTGLSQFVSSWGTRTAQTPNPWPDELPLIDLCYQLLTWLPTLQDSPESQVYLEIVARAITQTARTNSFRSRIVFEPTNFELPSVRQAIRNIFVPLAVGALSVNEDIVETLPRSAVNFLTIHQAKGLEYPVVIVDVAAHFRTNHRLQRRMRFPDQPDEVHLAEDETRSWGALNGVPARSAMNRAFDDLARLYYVAFSRPQSLLVLAGQTRAAPARNIPNVAVGWTRTGVSSWRAGLPYLEI